MKHSDLMAEIAEIITDMRRIEYNLDDPLRHCEADAKRLAWKILSDAAQQARDVLILVSSAKHEQQCAAKEAKP